jgi:predicted nucleic acid-binding protein
MPADFFLDTNVLVYTFDSSAPEKRRTARKLVADALEDGRGAISWQVLQEFLNVALNRFAKPLSVAEATEYLDEVLTPLCQVRPTPAVYREALAIRGETGLHFYDALVVAAAVHSGVATLYSEDLQSGRTVRGVRIENPFS